MHAYRDQYATLFRGGRDIVLIAISSDSPEVLASWARDDDFPFLMAADADGTVGARYGAPRSRNLFVVDPEGRIAYVATPFREIDPTAYDELGTAIEAVMGPSQGDQEP
jgi:peroxiredoxin Q/BCP